MAWETHNKAESLAKAQSMLNEGKSSDLIRELLINEGLTYPEADELISELSGSSNTGDSADSLGAMAAEKLKPEDTPRAIVFQLWKQGKSRLYIRNNLIDRGFSEEEIDEVLNTIASPSTKSQSTFSNYGSLGKNKQGQVQYQSSSNSSSGSTQVVIGLVIMVAGCAFTYFSYQSAANSPTGGTYYITYGPIIFGAWMLFKGLMNNN